MVTNTFDFIADTGEKLPRGDLLGAEYGTEKCAEARNILEKFYGHKNLRQLKYLFFGVTNIMPTMKGGQSSRTALSSVLL